MEFEWDSAKAESNDGKHGVSFPYATRAFLDENRLERFDGRDRYGEDRWITIGLVDEFELVVACTVRESQVIRIISARKANRYEREE